jgi:type III pantothenate kinase
MLLVLDVGNSTTVIGLFDGTRLIRRWRISTTSRTPDEYELLLDGLLAADAPAISGSAMASVVPSVTEALRPALARLTGEHVVVVGPGTKTGLQISVDNPREVGADRIANAIGAIDRHGVPVIAVDFGTATTVDLIGPTGAYLGGAIAPGVRVASEALIDSTSALRRVELTVPRHVIGRSTVEATQSGLMYGFAGLVDGLVARFFEEQTLADSTPVVATGGLAVVMAPLCRRVTAVDDDLTLWGLHIIFHRNPI